ncbi:MAG: RagB/SusD family nutrient uptake outer membrane protein [Bacteroides sp.]|jgi:hypothetical protein|nr:RagB/SusD family nutrient uptake outer membrane protein [Bacteroides sp.]MCI1683549.1 RagB/SusD family nutrient uptake outer membrane protein [Bacteroides sp.]
MKSNKFNLIYKSIFIIGLIFTSCEDFLDKEPMSNILPEQYLSSASQLENYVNKYYGNLPSHGNWSYGIYGNDNNTDNQAGVSIDSKYTSDLWKVGQSGGNWSFGNIYAYNYFFSQVFSKYGDDISGSANTISGSLADVQHYIGEMYFLRAYEYFNKLQAFGDFPIITEPLSDNSEELIEASKRSPRNEVARFIIEDLDKAITLMSAEDMATTRINKALALLFKSRVALYEGTWLKYFKGTAFVPNGTDWAGATKDYNSNYQYPSGSIDNEIDYFLGQAMDASKQIAESYKNFLAENTGVNESSGYYGTTPVIKMDTNNPYYNMFAEEDLSSVKEVLLWRQYARSKVTHNVNSAAGRGNYRIGLTRGFVNSFLMADGTPVYTHGTYADGDGYYQGDKTITNVRENRDSRLGIFLKVPGQQNVYEELDNTEGTEVVFVEPYPSITLGDGERGYATGYALHKGGSFNRKHYGNGTGYTAAVCFRAAEALLNYMEASYEKNGTIDSYADEYWRILRKRANIDPDYNKTISLTNMSKEAENDWGAYSAGTLIDATLYNIRRERRCEYIAEGLRNMDLHRWRALDQLKATPYHIEGFHLWNTPMEKWYTNLVANNTNNANVSSKERSEYLRPYERYAGQNGYNGSTWMMAYYLEPIAIKHFQLTATNSTDLSTSVIYQNPYWPLVADQSAEN